MRILIVEDDEDAARSLGLLLRKLIEPANVEVRVTARLDDALRITHEYKAHVTLLDLQLEDVTDWHITADAIHLFHQPVIVMTAEHDSEVELYCRARGAREVFYKPMALRMVEQLVSCMIGEHVAQLAPRLFAEREANGYAAAAAT
jgi:DNA-binding response OmpR family regulator